MKMILAILILFSAIALPSLCELTVGDIEKLDAKIKESESRTKEHINTRIESVDKRLSLVTTLIVALIALIVLAVGIPQILMALHSRRDESLESRLKHSHKKSKCSSNSGSSNPNERQTVTIFYEMVSDAVGAKVLGERSERTLSPVSPIRCVENKAKSRFTSCWIPMPSV